MDRIAAAAKANKAQIYHYFGSKDRLFDAAFEAIVVEIIADVPPEADDLVGYAGRLFDNYERRPDVRRMAAWRRLERGEAHPPLEPIVKSNRASIRAIAEAQTAGKISSHFAPVDLLADPSIKLDQAAREVGYGTAYALSAAFKRELGVSPREYRRRLAA